MEELELEIRRRPDAQRGLLHTIRSWSLSQLCQSFEFGGKVFLHGRNHNFRCRGPWLPPWAPVLASLSHEKEQRKEVFFPCLLSTLSFPSLTVYLFKSIFFIYPMLHSHWQVYIFYTCLDILHCPSPLLCNLGLLQSKEDTVVQETGAEALSKIFSTSIPVLTENIYLSLYIIYMNICLSSSTKIVVAAL